MAAQMALLFHVPLLSHEGGPRTTKWILEDFSLWDKLGSSPSVSISSRPRRCRGISRRVSRPISQSNVTNNFTTVLLRQLLGTRLQALITPAVAVLGGGDRAFRESSSNVLAPV